MEQKSTSELEKILGSTHVNNAGDFLEQNKDSLYINGEEFYVYVNELIREKKLKKQEIFLEADIPEKYGYKLLSGEKRTKQRDIILRICYAANFSLAETQKALRLYKMPELYAKVPRDALIIISINERPGSIIEVNAFLKKQGVAILRSSGTQE